MVNAVNIVNAVNSVTTVNIVNVVNVVNVVPACPVTLVNSTPVSRASFFLALLRLDRKLREKVAIRSA